MTSVQPHPFQLKAALGNNDEVISDWGCTQLAALNVMLMLLSQGSCSTKKRLILDDLE
jgi:hypothetical protein